MIATCRFCYEQIQWAQTLHTRLWVALDLASVPHGPLEVIHGDGTPIVRLVKIAEREGRSDLRRPHLHAVR